MKDLNKDGFRSPSLKDYTPFIPPWGHCIPSPSQLPQEQHVVEQPFRCIAFFNLIKSNLNSIDKISLKKNEDIALKFKPTYFTSDVSNFHWKIHIYLKTITYILHAFYIIRHRIELSSTCPFSSLRLIFLVMTKCENIFLNVHLIVINSLGHVSLHLFSDCTSLCFWV